MWYTERISKPSHPDKKCIVFSMIGVLCCEDPTKKPNSTDVTYNYIHRHGIIKLFLELLESKFAIGIWSALPCRKLIPLLEYLVLKELNQRLSFVWDRDMCGSPKNDTLCFKPLKTLNAVAEMCVKRIKFLSLMIGH